ncbi:MAG: hypothetical protein VKK04_00570 [Synechococcales bacterium]|nr:hypothetical protein [Synechococcales bacterium]
MTDIAIKKAGSQISKQLGGTETYSKNVLGPVAFTLCNLQIRGLADEPEEPKNVAPTQSPYIVASNEQFEVSVDIEFNTSPLTRLLLCLGTKLTVCFSFEGVGAKAVEIDLEDTDLTRKDVFKYTLSWKGTPEMAELTAGFYGIAAVATVGPIEHPCAPKCAYGFGYIAGALFQVYDAFEAH